MAWVEGRGGRSLSSSTHTLLSAPPSVAQAPGWGPSRQLAFPRCYWCLQQRMRQPNSSVRVGGSP